MNVRKIVLVAVGAGAAMTLAHCGSGSSSPTGGGPSPLPVPTPTPAPTPTPTPTNPLPPGMWCGDPTPPPLMRMHLKIHSNDGVRIILDSKPLVKNVDNYCDKVGIGGGKFCDTRPEGHPERFACDYLITGKAEDTGRWGPTWYYKNDLCAKFPTSCANHSTNQFMAIAKDPGMFEACASETSPVAEDGSRCGNLEIP